MERIQKDIEELLSSENPEYDGSEPIDLHLKNIAECIRDLQDEKKESPRSATAIDITIRSLENIRDGYLALAAEEAEGARRAPELNHWPVRAPSYDLAAVAEG